MIRTDVRCKASLVCISATRKFCSMGGPKFCPMRTTQEIRKMAEEGHSAA